LGKRGGNVGLGKKGGKEDKRTQPNPGGLAGGGGAFVIEEFVRQAFRRERMENFRYEGEKPRGVDKERNVQ